MAPTSRKVIVIDGRTATPHFPGIGRYVRSLVGEMRKLMHPDEDLAVIVTPDQSDLAKEFAGAGSIKFLHTQSSPFSLQQQWQIPQTLRSAGADVYHSPYYLMPYWPGAPTILTVYDLIPLWYPDQVSSRARLMFRWTTSMALRAARHLIAISGATRNDVRGYFKLDDARITAISLAAGPQFTLQSQDEIQRVRRVYNLPQDFILYFGINKPHKNLERLVQSMVYTSPGGEKLTRVVNLVIAGAWDTRYPEPRQRVEELGIADRVNFLGPIPEADLPGLYAAATVFVYPSLYEGFGLPVLEAMACGVPVACADTSSLAEIAAGSAILFDPQSPLAIAEALFGLLADPALQTDLRERGVRRAREFSWERTAEATLSVYRQQFDG